VARSFKAPFPWFGGKALVAAAVWRRFGAVRHYIEPFFGSGAVLLARPLPVAGVETINDADGLVSNFRRATKAAPAAVAEYADWPVNENDLHARHAWLVARKDTLQKRLEADPDYYDAQVAGWWAWGLACWIGSGFCAGNEGRGLHRGRVHLSNNQGIRHASAQSAPDTASAGLGEAGLRPWLAALSARLARVRVCCGDWTRVCGGATGNALAHFFNSGEPCAVFLDPPYSAEAGRYPDMYLVEDTAVAHAVREWAIAHGDDRRLRIALCGYDGEHAMPPSWICEKWKANGGMSSVAKNAQARARANRFRERIWFNRHCARQPYEMGELFQ
jgi:DNA adenine methylase